MERQLFANRQEAGRMLGRALQHYAHRDDVVVLALPRGGVQVAVEVARQLDAPLDVFLVRKLGAPGHEELAMGAIASGGVRVFNQDVLDSIAITAEEMEQVIAREEKELKRREEAYRSGSAPLSLEGQICLVVDDGLATGATMRAAVEALRQHEPAKVVVAVPTAPAETCQTLAQLADEVVCLNSPRPFFAVGMSYSDFAQVSDEEVVTLLRGSRIKPPAGSQA